MAVDESNARLDLLSNKIRDVPVQMPADYIMWEIDVNISARERRKLTPQMMDEAELVVIINGK